MAEDNGKNPGMLAEFARYGGWGTSGKGIWAPTPTLLAVAEEAEALAKAGKQTKALEAKIGTLFSYYYGIWQNMVTWGAADKPKGTPPYKMLREAANRSVVDALIINARLHQARHVSQVVSITGEEKGWRVVHKRHSDPLFKATDGIKKRCLEMEEMINAPNPEVHPSGFKDVLLKAIQGELIIDRKVMVKIAGQDGLPRSYHLLPPDGIKPRFQVLHQYMQQYPGLSSPSMAMKFVWDKQRIDLTNAAYVQILDDARIYGAWEQDEISVDLTNPSDEVDRWGFGVSCLERSLEVSTILMRALQYNKNLFETNFPEAFLIFQGKVNQEGLDAFKKQVYAEVGPGGNQRLPMFATGDMDAVNKVTLTKLRDTLKDMNFPQLVRMMVAWKCAAYRAHPSLVNMAPDSGGQRPLINSETQEDAIALTQEEGLHSLLSNTAEWITRVLIMPWYDDLKMIFTVQDAPKEIEDLQVWTLKTQVGETVDEYRAAHGQKPLMETTGVDGNYINNPLFFQQKQLKMMEEQQKQQADMAEQYGETGDFQGMEGGPPGQPAPGGNGGPPQMAAPGGGGNGGKPSTGQIPPAKAAVPTIKKSLIITVE